MPFNSPSLEDLKRAAEANYFSLSDTELHVFKAFIDASIPSYEWFDQLDEPKPQYQYERSAGRAPLPEENPLGAWAWRCSIKGASEGPLAGKRIALKDTVSVAGMPLRNGSKFYEGFVPDRDATIVTRILDAGGEIIGKAMCENFSFSGGSHTSYPWPVRNPHNPEFMAGGSSSGSAALVSAGECDVSIGCDQAGSIRIPSSWCGTFGLKPTYGLVPYTGILPIEATVDHVGPIARNVKDLATLLSVIAGVDGLDPRQIQVPSELPAYDRELEKPLETARVGVVTEGFSWPGLSEPDSDAAVRDAAAHFESLRCRVREISIPMHRNGIHMFTVSAEGLLSVFNAGGAGRGLNGYYDTSLVEFFDRTRRLRGAELPPTVKLALVRAQHLVDQYHGHYYAKVQNLRRVLAAAYDDALKDVDALIMPSTPYKPARHKADATLPETLFSALANWVNTCPFNLTGHPAINVPCGFSAGLPVGMMLVGRRFEEATLLRLAHAFEETGHHQ